jgi:ribosomal protein S3
LPIQTYKTRVEYGYSEGLTRSGLIGIKLWIFYKKVFKNFFKRKVLQYMYYSKHKNFLTQPLLQINNNYVKTKSKKISKK